MAQGVQDDGLPLTLGRVGCEWMQMPQVDFFGALIRKVFRGSTVCGKVSMVFGAYFSGSQEDRVFSAAGGGGQGVWARPGCHEAHTMSGSMGNHTCTGARLDFRWDWRGDLIWALPTGTPQKCLERTFRLASTPNLFAFRLSFFWKQSNDISPSWLEGVEKNGGFESLLRFTKRCVQLVWMLFRQLSAQWYTNTIEAHQEGWA